MMSDTRSWRRVALPLFGAAALAGLAASALAQSPPATQVFESAQYRYSVALPAGCRHDEGPGTIDAICTRDLDAEKSATARADASFLLQVGVERVAGDAGRPATDLAQSYGEAAFKQELPEAVCGETDLARIKIDGIKQVLEEGRVVYTAGVTCPEVKFLGLGERKATVRFLITPGLRYRLVARAPTDDFAQRKDNIEAFFTSFRVLP